MIADLKPYPEYLESGLPWVGTMPANWQQRRMKFLFHERVMKGFPDKPLLAATQTKGVVRKEDYGTRTVTAQKDLHFLKLVETGDFVISLRSFQGGIELAHCQGIISPAYTVLAPMQDTHCNYFKHFFKSPDFISSLTLFVTGIREGQNIDYERLSRAYMPLPSSEDQELIGRFLDHITRRIERTIRAKRKVIALLYEQKQVIIHRAVTRGFDPNVRLKPSEIPWLGEIPEHWEVLPVKRCSTVISKGTTPSTEGRVIFDIGPIRFIKAESISGGEIVNKPIAFIDHDTNAVLRRSQLQEKDILFVIAGATLGKVAIVQSKHLPANTNQAVAFIRPNKRVVPEYLAVWLQSPRIREQIWLNAVQSAQPNLSMGSLGNFAVPLPPVDEQSVIVNGVSAELNIPNTIIIRTEREIDLLREYRTRLIADVVTGKLDVRDVAARLPDEAEKLEYFDEINDSAEIEEMDAVAEGEA
jgi:type I restriction enzyme S subunit